MFTQIRTSHLYLAVLLPQSQHISASSSLFPHHCIHKPPMIFLIFLLIGSSVFNILSLIHYFSPSQPCFFNFVFKPELSLWWTHFLFCTFWSRPMKSLISPCPMYFLLKLCSPNQTSYQVSLPSCKPSIALLQPSFISTLPVHSSSLLLCFAHCFGRWVFILIQFHLSPH